MKRYFLVLPLLVFIISSSQATTNSSPKTGPLLVPVLMVKNEAAVIGKTLQPFVDAGIKDFFIFDTGSTDDTIVITRRYFNNNNVTKGVIKQEPFVDFCTSRNRALTLAKKSFPSAVFMVMPDAEWYLHNVQGLLDFCKEHQEESYDYYSMRIKTDLDYTNQRLFRCSGNGRFEGAVHEYVMGSEGVCVPADVYFAWQPTPQGIEKSRQRWERDRDILLKEQAKNPQDPRTVFYLAQTYECLGDKNNAIKWFIQRIAMNGFDEEKFVAHCRLASLYKQQNNWPKALYYYLKAYLERPSRAEPLIHLAQHYDAIDEQPLRYLFARRAVEIPYPKKDRLFISKDLYDYDRHNLLGISAWYTSDYAQGKKAVHQALKARPHEAHLHKNLSLYADKEKELALKKPIDHITISILAKDKAHVLPLYLSCIEQQTWPKDKTYIYIRTNNNNDTTATILQNWIAANKDLYAGVHYDATDLPVQVQKYGQHEWNAERFAVLAQVRQDSINWAREHDSHYFVADCDNFIKPHTLKSLADTNLSIVAPLLRMSGAKGTANDSFSYANSTYSNFHAAVDSNGYFAENPLYYQLLNREIKGLIEVPVVHCSYFINHTVLDKIAYSDGTERYEYVIFSDKARKNDIPQYLDTREVYGNLTFAETEAQLQAEPWLNDFNNNAQDTIILNPLLPTQAILDKHKSSGNAIIKKALARKNTPDQKDTPATIGVVTVSTPNRRTFASITSKRLRNYCTKWGYTYHEYKHSLDTSRPEEWSKILALQDVMKKNPKYAWLLWIDDDIFITNPRIRLEDFIEAYGNNKDLIIGQDTINKALNMYINNGIFLLQNNENMRAFLRDVWETGKIKNYLVRGASFLEQAAMTDCIKNNPQYGNATEIVPFGVLQSFLHSNFVNTHQAWIPHVFSAHAAGMSHEDRVRIFTNMAKQGELPQTID